MIYPSLIQKHLSTYMLLVACTISVFFSTYATAQDLTGVWQGKFYSSGELMLGGAYKYEVQIADDNGKLKGVTYSYLTTVFYGKAALVGFFRENNRTVVIKETEMLEMKASEGSDGCLMTCTLHYSKKGDEAYLTGSYTSVNMHTGLACGGGTVSLRKTDHSDFYKEKILLDHRTRKSPSNKRKKPIVKSDTKSIKIKKNTVKHIKPKLPIIKISTKPEVKKPVIKPPVKPAAMPVPPVKRVEKPINHIPIDTTPKPKLPTVLPVTIKIKEQKDVLIKNAPTILKERNNEVSKTIYTDADFITVKLYDNGEIDRDTITVYHNNQIVVYKQQLDVKPIIVRIEISEKDPYHEFTLVANNLGEIPPNTALMVVTAGEKRYEIQLASTEQKNAKVIFEYKKAP